MSDLPRHASLTEPDCHCVILHGELIVRSPCPVHNPAGESR